MSLCCRRLRCDAGAGDILISQTQIGDPSLVVQAVKLGFLRRVMSGQQNPPRLAKNARHGAPTKPFLAARFCDFNVWSQPKVVEKLKYIHRNPVVRGLVEKPDGWRWSSYRSYAYGEPGLSGSTTGDGGRRRFETRSGISLG